MTSYPLGPHTHSLPTTDDDLIARLKGERGTALQAATCYKEQRDLAWAEIDRLKALLTRP